MTSIPTPFLVLENFLSVDDRAELIRFVHTDGMFGPAMVTVPGAHAGSPDDTFRRAQVSTPAADLFGHFEDALRALLPHVRKEIGVPYFSMGDTERQVTAHGDGDFFGLHTDVGDYWAETASRRISFVYYFHEHPRTFSGGELRLYGLHASSRRANRLWRGLSGGRTGRQHDRVFS